MKEFLNFLRDFAGVLIFFIGALGLIWIFWYFMFEYQSRQHAHEQNIQTVQITHECQMASNQKNEEMDDTKKRFAGRAFEWIVGIAQKFIGL